MADIEYKRITWQDEPFYYSLSFDIDDFVGTGAYWLQIYDYRRRLIYDKPFASSRGNIDAHRIVETIKQELQFAKGVI